MLVETFGVGARRGGCPAIFYTTFGYEGEERFGQKEGGWDLRPAGGEFGRHVVGFGGSLFNSRFDDMGEGRKSLYGDRDVPGARPISEANETVPIRVTTKKEHNFMERFTI